MVVCICAEQTERNRVVNVVRSDKWRSVTGKGSERVGIDFGPDRWRCMYMCSVNSEKEGLSCEC